MHQESSYGEWMKFHVMINEMDRIMRNTSPYLPFEDGLNPSLEYFVKRMKYSGYSKLFIHDTIQYNTIYFREMLYSIISGLRAVALRTFSASRVGRNHSAPFFRFEGQFFLRREGGSDTKIIFWGSKTT